MDEVERSKIQSILTNLVAETQNRRQEDIQRADLHWQDQSDLYSNAIEDINQHILRCRKEELLLGVIDLYKIDMKFGVEEFYRICSEHNNNIHERIAQIDKELKEGA